MSATGQSISQYRTGLQYTQSAITRSGAVGTFDSSVVYVSKQSDGIATSGVSSYNVRNIATLGNVQTTNIGSDLAFSGSNLTAMFAVQLQDGSVAYTPAGSFRQGQDGKFYTPGGATLMGWQLDAKGQLPTDTSTVSSLTPITSRNAAATAIPTSKIALGMNLKATQAALQGPGGILNPSISGFNSDDAKEILIPGMTSLGELQIGNTLTLQASDIGTSYTYEYGGVAVSKAINANNTMYGSQASGDSFTVNDTGGAGALKKGDTLSITAGTQTFTFKATSEAGAAATAEFNSLSSLADAINEKNGLRARIGTDNRLYISADDANLAISFTETGNSNMIQTFGLDNVAATTNPTVRFASLEELRNKINASSANGLTASIDNAGNLNFSASDPKSSLQIGGTHAFKRSIYTVYSGWSDADAARVSQFTNVATIQSPNHLLKQGDYVRLAGGPNGLANGVYEVMKVDTNGDSFVVGTSAALGNGDVGGVLAKNLKLSTPAQDGSFTWQKVDGGNVALATITGNGATTITANLANNGARTAVIANLTGDPQLGAYQYNAGDVVYISGSAYLKDGYYTVSALAPTQITVDYNGGGAGGAVADNDLKADAAAGQLDAAIKITKVTAATVNPNILDTFPLKTVPNAENASIVQIAVTKDNSHLQKGDVISFRNLATDTVAFDGISITKNKYYTVLNVDKAAGIIQVRVDPTNPAANPTGQYIGFANTAAAGAVPGALDQAAGTTLGENAHIDYISRSLGGGLGMKINTGVGAEATLNNNAQYLQNPLKSTYDPADSTKNFAGGQALDPERTFTQTVGIIDNLGVSHNVSITFGKVGKNNWAVEIYAAKNPDGSYDAGERNSGQIAYGNITFGGTGQLQSPTGTIAGPIRIDWNRASGAESGAANSEVRFNWGAIGGKNEDGTPGISGMTQLDTDNTTRFIDNDGVLPGNANGFYYDESGTFYVTFDNGQNVAVFRAAAATFADFNGLTEKNGFYFQSTSSGPVLLKQAGSAGVAEIIAGAITGSAVDQTGHYLRGIEIAQAIELNTNILRTANNANKYVIEQL